MSVNRLATDYAFGCEPRRRDKTSPHGHELSRDDPAERQQTVSSRSQPASERELPTLSRLPVSSRPVIETDESGRSIRGKGVAQPSESSTACKMALRTGKP
jgi:hypothetical protein